MDLSKYSDEELNTIASGVTPKSTDLSSYSDEELEKIANPSASKGASGSWEAPSKAPVWEEKYGVDPNKLYGKDPGKVESFGRGVGSTFLGDELEALAGALGYASVQEAEDDTKFWDVYREARKNARARNEQAWQQHPGYYGTGKVAGIAGATVLPTPKIFGKGAGRDFAIGAGFGLSESEADLTSGDPMQYGQAALETGLSGGLSAAAPFIPSAMKKGVQLAGRGINKLNQEAGEWMIQKGIGQLPRQQFSKLIKEGTGELEEAALKNVELGQLGKKPMEVLKGLEREQVLGTRELGEAEIPSAARRLYTEGRKGFAGSPATAGIGVLTGLLTGDDKKVETALKYGAGGFFLGPVVKTLVSLAGRKLVGKASQNIAKAYRAGETRAGAALEKFMVEETTDLEKFLAKDPEIIGAVIKEQPEIFGKFENVIADSIRRGPQYFKAVDYVLQQRDPEYKEVMDEFQKNLDALQEEIKSNQELLFEQKLKY